jgi:chromosome segregation ATPase
LSTTPGLAAPGPSPEKTQSDYVSAVVSAYEGPLAILTLTDKLIQINAQVLAKIVSEPASGGDFAASEAGKSVADLTAKIEAEIEKLDSAEGKAIAAGIKTARASEALRGSLATASSLNTGAKGVVAKITKQHNEILGLNDQVFALSKQVSDLNLQVADNQKVIGHLNGQLASAEQRYTDAEASLNRTAKELVEVKEKLALAPKAEDVAALQAQVLSLQSEAKALAVEADVWFMPSSALVKKYLSKK